MTESPKELIVSSFSSECGIVIQSECILIFRPEGLNGIIKPSPVKKGYFYRFYPVFHTVSNRLLAHHFS